MGSNGDEIMVKKAAIVVMLVKKMGISKESMVEATASRTSFFERSSLKYLVTT